MIQQSISENSRRNHVEGTEIKYLWCSSMDRRRTLLDTACTVGEYGGRWYGTHWFSTVKGSCMNCGKQKGEISLPRLYQAFSTLTLRKDCQKCNCCQSLRSS